MILELNKNEIEVLKDYLIRKTTRLEESGLSDCRCYLAMISILHKIYERERMTITTKQIKLINDICSMLGLKNPNIQTKEDASKFISKYIERYKELCAVEYYNWKNEIFND